MAKAARTLQWRLYRVPRLARRRVKGDADEGEVEITVGSGVDSKHKVGLDCVG